jgi:hypothetical protein
MSTFEVLVAEDQSMFQIRGIDMTGREHHVAWLERLADASKCIDELLAICVTCTITSSTSMWSSRTHRWCGRVTPFEKVEALVKSGIPMR